jgi:glycogen debranching enzyme
MQMRCYNSTICICEPILIESAFIIAKTTLRQNYDQNGITAGATHFNDLWARDSLFASMGALALVDYEIVRNNLSTLLRNRSEQGQIPLRVGNIDFLRAYFGLRSRRGASYHEDKLGNTPVDSNSLLIIIAARYATASGDYSFIKKQYTALKQVMEWNFTCDTNNDGILEEQPYCGWADSLKKDEQVLYTNVLHFAALTGFAEIAKQCGYMRDAERFLTAAERLQKAIDERFWNGEFYIDYLDSPKQYFAIEGNALAILFGLASGDRARRIQQTMIKFGLNDNFCPPTNHPRYLLREVFLPFYFMNLHKYHNGFTWLWVGCVDAIAKAKAGQHDVAIESIEKIAHKIIEYNGVYEVYNNGVPVRQLLYKSEKSFAWSAGLFVFACKELKLV